MKLDVRHTHTDANWGTKVPTVVLHKQDAEELGVNPLDRMQVSHNGEVTVAVVDIHENFVDPGTIGIPEQLDVQDSVDVSIAPKPQSVRYIRRKLDGGELSRKQIDAIINDINEDRLNDVELGAYVSAIYANDMSMDETIHLSEAMTEAGDVMEWETDILADKHSIGGVAGNRVTPIVVAIVAAAGVKIPKTSSRAITSPAGTADTVEALCDVEFSLDEIRDIVDETNGCMVWGGSVNLSPVDDKIIRAEHPLSLDPDGQVIASVLSKKRSAGSTHVVIDIPYGEGSKVENIQAAREMAHDFKKVGEHLGMELTCTITDGTEPIGNGIGPILEARDILEILEGDGPKDLELKSLELADAIFDLCGVDKDARDILESGQALDKFREIVAAQNGDKNVSADSLEPGEHTEVIRADTDGTLTRINNALVGDIARRAGAPKDQGAGVYLHKTVGDSVDRDDQLFTIYAENKNKLADAMKVAEDTSVMRIQDRDETLVERV